uniref:Uncharacterized protein n=1 Tax=Oryza sativa subsp. japonica TaxID=39947 RepID=Q6ZCE9_ORYSJ|nr:hypothetical protein [Oryza sativa Japonica Group]BAD11550.1 hypothetical protein [Oryza sativa Japonica Group]
MEAKTSRPGHQWWSMVGQRLSLTGALLGIPPGCDPVGSTTGSVRSRRGHHRGDSSRPASTTPIGYSFSPTVAEKLAVEEGASSSSLLSHNPCGGRDGQGRGNTVAGEMGRHGGVPVEAGGVETKLLGRWLAVTSLGQHRRAVERRPRGCFPEARAPPPAASSKVLHYPRIDAAWCWIRTSSSLPAPGPRSMQAMATSTAAPLCSTMSPTPPPPCRRPLQGVSNAFGNAIRHGLYGDHGVDAHCGGQHAVIAHIQLLRLPALAMGVDGAVAHRGAHPAATHVVHRAEEAPRLF